MEVKTQIMCYASVPAQGVQGDNTDAIDLQSCKV